jgi:hypothetical protein
MTHDDHFKAALSMIHVTPDNYKNLTVEMIMSIYGIVGMAEKNLRETPEDPASNKSNETPSRYDNSDAKDPAL